MVKIHQLKREIKDTLHNALSTLFKLHFNIYLVYQGFLGGSAVKIPPNAGDAGLIPGLGSQRYQGNISCKDGLNKGQKWYGPNRSRRF